MCLVPVRTSALVRVFQKQNKNKKISTLDTQINEQYGSSMEFVKKCAFIRNAEKSNINNNNENNAQTRFDIITQT